VGVGGAGVEGARGLKVLDESLENHLRSPFSWVSHFTPSSPAAISFQASLQPNARKQQAAAPSVVLVLLGPFQPLEDFVEGLLPLPPIHPALSDDVDEEERGVLVAQTVSRGAAGDRSLLARSRPYLGATLLPAAALSLSPRRLWRPPSSSPPSSAALSSRREQTGARRRRPWESRGRGDTT